MGADSRMTNIYDEYLVNDNAEKLFFIKDNTIGISCCGDASIDGKSIAAFIREFDIKESRACNSVSDIADRLIEYGKINKDRNITFHICGYSDDNQECYIIQNWQRKELISGSAKYGIKYNGQIEAIKYLFGEDKNAEFDLDKLNLKDGIELIEYLIDLTIKYKRFKSNVNPDCGGPIDILVITQNSCEFINHKIFKQ